MSCAKAILPMPGKSTFMVSNDRLQAGRYVVRAVVMIEMSCGTRKRKRRNSGQRLSNNIAEVTKSAVGRSSGSRIFSTTRDGTGLQSGN